MTDDEVKAKYPESITLNGAAHPCRLTPKAIVTYIPHTGAWHDEG